MNTEANQISAPEDVQGFKTGKFAKILLKNLLRTSLNRNNHWSINTFLCPFEFEGVRNKRNLSALIKIE
ncbi:hypothetical protein IU403_03355 [Aerococcaceae bacterium zg-BR22]|uniref:hypothetical protein n=1 Tax=Aerococcaceae bacterium zg-1292 TaxID=2774330 RepID=UPI004064927B|nr:hypothetical protein [Aerococcaceae bacterium zg-BR22]